MAWSSQGRHHCLRGGEEPPGLSGPVEGREQGKREQAGAAVRKACLRHKGTWQGQKQTQDSRSDKVPRVSEPQRDGEGSQVQADNPR